MATPVGLLPAPPPGSRSAQPSRLGLVRAGPLGTLRRAPESTEAPDPRSPHPSPRRSARQLPPVTARPPLCDPFGSRGRLPGPAVAVGGASPTPPTKPPPGPARPAPVPASWGAPELGTPPHPDVGKLPGVAGVGQAVPRRSFCPLPPTGPRTLRPSPPPQAVCPRRAQGGQPDWAPPPPTLKNKNKTRPFRASWVCQGTGASGLWSILPDCRASRLGAKRWAGAEAGAFKRLSRPGPDPDAGSAWTRLAPPRDSDSPAALRVLLLLAAALRNDGRRR